MVTLGVCIYPPLFRARSEISGMDIKPQRTFILSQGCGIYVLEVEYKAKRSDI